MRRYETIFILRPSLNENEINTIIDNTTSILTTDGGQIIEADRWGMKKLAYQIKKESQGFYVYLDYSGTPDAVAEMERKFRIDDAVLRYMSIKTAEEISAEEISEATQKATEKQSAASEEDLVEEEADQADDEAEEESAENEESEDVE